MPRRVFIFAAALGSLILVPVTPAAPPSQWSGAQPVDQGVADLDPLSTSLRTVQVGLRTTGEQSNLYQRALPAGEPDYDRAQWVTTGFGRQQVLYYRVGPGFRARVSRLHYLVRVGDKSLGVDVAARADGEFVELIPNDTVFELNPPRLYPASTADDYARPGGAAAGPAGRVLPVSGRVDGQVNGHVDGRAGR